ncbi:helix-turn-helix domain-containing protein [Burkholderia cepacia]|uniref:helix-turn-helix domain-containing protein n=1 Tax=Burkholderia cepacia TaxID=292 RepID=UPI001CF48EC7|nr:helix-turn-helix transcriptional regulator [Burkholderia cepacia]MCA8326238.1 helix-turn-helix domain-containing protein [Burkholderia cepacia]
MNKTLTDDLREQLTLIERCQPDLLLMHIREKTAFDANLLTKVFELAKERAGALLAAQQPEPIDMLLFCPECGEQHVDAPEPADADIDVDGTVISSTDEWTNPPHRSHLCHACGTIWRPADVPTNGVASIQTRGKADTWDGKPEPRAEAADWNTPCTGCSTPRACQYGGCRNEPSAEVTDEQPSLTNPLTPYGMLVRALRIVSGTTLMDMAKALLTTPAKLSAMEFGRTPITLDFALDVAAYFDALGVPDTLVAIRRAIDAARAGGQHADQA